MHSFVNMKTIIWLLGMVAWCGHAPAQPREVNVSMAHSHNDYFRSVPFYKAYSLGFGSIEADILVVDGQVIVAHDKKGVDPKRTLKRLYIDPIVEQMNLHEGKIYPNGKKLQLYIDLKTNHTVSIPALTKLIRPVREYFDVRHNPDAVKIVLSGAIPKPEQFSLYDDIFFFDGYKDLHYTPEQFERVAIYNAPFFDFSHWNGRGRPIKSEYDALSRYVDSIHRLGKPVRFWATPDSKIAYHTFIKLGFDYINTDKPEELAVFLNHYKKGIATADFPAYTPYQPTYASDNADRAPKNIILFISDGAGLAHLWSAATVNGGRLNVMTPKNMGYARTVSADNYSTDSAAAGTALATGKKTRNRYIGLDPQGNKLANIPERLADKNIPSALLTTDKITGATPSAFYAHQSDRDHSEKIVSDFLTSPVSLLIGGYDQVLDQKNKELLQRMTNQNIAVCRSLPEIGKIPAGKRILCLAEHIPGQKVSMLEKAFSQSLARMRQSGNGFFMMVEGAKIDSGAHANDMQYVVREYLDFDRTLAQALEFADQDKNTLVIITSDHETGGITLHDGEYGRNVTGAFESDDHTGIVVPVLAYGPRSGLFRGFMDNTEIPKKILSLFLQE